MGESRFLLWLRVASCLLLLGIVCPQQGKAQDTYWTGDTGNWSEATNWDNGEPTSLTYAYISNGGTAQVLEADEQCYHVYLGEIEAQTGAVEMTAGQLSTACAYVGLQGSGAFTQTGGTNLVTESLYLAYEAGATGSYELSGTGQLSAGSEYVGYDGTGSFAQTGGGNTTGYLSVNSTSEYEFSGGTLEVTDSAEVLGTLDFAGSSVSVTMTGLVNFGDAVLIGPEAASLTVNANSLTIFPASFDPDAEFATFSNSGLVHNRGSTLTISSGEGFAGRGRISDHVECEGLVVATLGWPTLDLYEGVSISGNGSVDLGNGSLRVNDEVSGISDAGQLSTGLQVVETGRLSQSGGVNTIGGRLILGTSAGTNGIYELSGSAQLSAPWEHVGEQGTGVLTQSGGSNTVGVVFVGRAGTSNGTYELSGTGQLTGAVEIIGFYGTGSLIQTGGTNTISDFLSVGYGAGSDGTYSLSADGELWAEEEYVGDHGTGLFRQLGGTNTVNGFLLIGADFDSEGTYELSGNGQLSCAEEAIGGAGAGQFVQSGGTNTIGDCLRVGTGWNTIGVYNLSNGLLTAYDEHIGDFGIGILTQTGGSNVITGSLFLGYEEVTGGAYALGGDGQLSASDEYLGYGYWSSGTLTQTGGTNTANNIYVAYMAQGAYTISGGQFNAGSLYVGYDYYEVGTFAIEDPGAEITVSELLRFGERSTFTAVEGSTIHMTGAAFENECCAPTELEGLGNLRLVFEGGTEDIDLFEVAGENRLPPWWGYIENFALGTLQLGGDGPDAPIGQVQLIDAYDNQEDGSDNEALYVDTLILREGSVLDLNGLNLYYKTFIDEGGQILLNGGSLMRSLQGDRDMDGFVGQNDLDIVLDQWGHGYPSPPNDPITDPRADADGNGFVGQGDLDIVLDEWGEGTQP